MAALNEETLTSLGQFTGNGLLQLTVTPSGGGNLTGLYIEGRASPYSNWMRIAGKRSDYRQTNGPIGVSTTDGANEVMSLASGVVATIYIDANKFTDIRVLAAGLSGTSAVCTVQETFGPVAMVGQLLMPNGSISAPSYAYSGVPSTGFYLNSTVVQYAQGGVAGACFTGSSFSLPAGALLAWTGSSDPSSGRDTVLTREGPGQLVLRNAANAQAFRVYNTYTDASNYERLEFGWASNQMVVATSKLGTGAARDLILRSSSGYLGLGINGGTSINLGSGAIQPTSAGGFSLGTGAFGWKQLYIDYTNTGTVGAVTINKAAGRVNVAAAGTSIVVTNSLVTANSEVFAVVSQADTTAYIKNVVPASGSFTITLGAAATAQTSISFFVVNTD